MSTDDKHFLFISIFTIIGCLGLLGMILPLHKIIIPLIGTCVIAITIMYGLFTMSVDKENKK